MICVYLRMDSDSDDSEENNGHTKPCAKNPRGKLAMMKIIGKSNYENDVKDDLEEKNKVAKKKNVGKEEDQDQP